MIIPKSIQIYFSEIAFLLGGQRQKLLILFFGFIILAFLELSGLGIALPYIAVLIDRTAFEESVISSLFVSLRLPTRHPIPELLIGAILLSIFLFRTILGIVIKYYSVKFSWDQNVRLRTLILSGYFELPYLNNVEKNSAELIQATENYTDSYANSLILLLQISSDILVALFIFSFLLYTNVSISIVALAGFFSFGFLYDRGFKKIIKSSGETANTSTIRAIQLIQDSINGYKEIKILGKENFFVSLVRQESRKVGAAHTKSIVISDASRFVLEFGVMVLIVSLFSIALLADLTNNINLPVIATFIIGILRLVPSSQKSINAILRIRFFRPQVIILARELRQVLHFSQKHPDHERLPPKNRKLAHQFHELTLNNVCFRYPGRIENVLDDVSLTIKNGEMIGIIGPSGSGKTTLIDIILGFLPPTAGEVNFNGESIDKNMKKWRSLIAYLPQNDFILDADFLSNIALDSNITDLQLRNVHRAITQARLDELISELPTGVHTLLGEKGSRLSGGQIQRISLARAFFHEREILLMDEATNALDAETESQLLENIRLFKKIKTVVVIAHNISNLKSFDRIFKVKSGRLQEVYPN